MLQLDEPSLPAVLAGTVPTPSGYGTVAAVEANSVESRLRDVLDVAPAGGRVVHCCAPEVPVDLLRAAGADALAVDLDLVDSADYDVLGEAIEAGTSLWLGVVPAVDAEVTHVEARRRIERLWSALGFASGRLAEAVVPTPACGLGGATPAYARRATALVRDVGRRCSTCRTEQAVGRRYVASCVLVVRMSTVGSSPVPGMPEATDRPPISRVGSSATPARR